MAVIYCPDCKKEMSDTASVCPNCGYPYAQKKELYLKAVKLMQSCTTSDGFLGVAELFHSIPEFQDSKSLETECRTKAGVCYQQEKEREEQERKERFQREQEQRAQWEQEQIRQEQERIRRIEEEKQRREQEWRENQERIEKQQVFLKKYKIAIIVVGILIFSGAIAAHFIINKQIAVQSSTVSAGIASTIVLNDNNSVVVISTGIGHSMENQTNVAAISTGDTALEKTLLLLNDGTVVGYDWENIISVSTGGWHDVGLKSDGTVVATGDNTYGQCNTSSWKDIKAISAGDCHTIGVKEDGTVVATGDNRFGQCNVSAWHDKTVALCDLFKPLVVVSSVPAGVLDAMNIGVVMTELVLKGCTDILDWTIKGPSSNVDLMGAAQRRNPGILSQGEVTISSGGTLDCYSGSGKFPRKIVLVEQVENVI